MGHFPSILLLFVSCLPVFGPNISSCDAVRLESLSVPGLVRNGTVQSVILDCKFQIKKYFLCVLIEGPYSLSPAEKEGMVLKWYMNSRSNHYLGITKFVQYHIFI